MDVFTRIVRLLPQLDDEQLDALVVRIKALQQFGQGANANALAHADETFVLNAIHDTLHQQGADYTAVGVMRKTATTKLVDGHSFRDKVPGLMEFLQTAHPEYIGQHAILLLGLKLLVMDLRKQGGVVTFKTLMAQIHRIGPVLDAHFPAYAKAGMLRFVVEAPEKRRFPSA